MVEDTFNELRKLRKVSNTKTQIIDIIDGKDAFNQCLIRTSSCSNESPCSLHDKVAPYRKGLRSTLLTETIADLASEFRKGNERIRI